VFDTSKVLGHLSKLGRKSSKKNWRAMNHETVQCNVLRKSSGPVGKTRGGRRRWVSTGRCAQTRHKPV